MGQRQIVSPGISCVYRLRHDEHAPRIPPQSGFYGDTVYHMEGGWIEFCVVMRGTILRGGVGESNCRSSEEVEIRGGIVRSVSIDQSRSRAWRWKILQGLGLKQFGHNFCRMSIFFAQTWPSTRSVLYRVQTKSSSTAVEVTAEEQKDPSNESEPNGVSGMGAAYGIYSGLCDEEEGDIDCESADGGNSGKP